MMYKNTIYKKTFCSILIILSLIASSCSIKKRSYRKGFYVDWVFSGKKVKTQNTAEKLKAASPAHSEQTVTIAEMPESEIVSASPEIKSFSEQKRPSLLDDECGDIITLKKGDRIKAKVMEVGISEIKYKTCDNLNGPLIVISKANVYSIKYPNGHEDHFFDTPKIHDKKPEVSEQGKKELHPLAVASLVCTILLATIVLWPIASLLGLILGSIAAGQIRERPNEYRGLEMARTCAIICGIAFFLLVFLIVLLIAAL